nr:hypothetical protein [Clostridia bacterium]
MERFKKMVERITGKTFGIMMVDEYADYQGCRNCEHQPEPLRMCEWGEYRSIVEPICTRWEKKTCVRK